MVGCGFVVALLLLFRQKVGPKQIIVVFGKTRAKKMADYDGKFQVKSCGEFSFSA